ncbi:MAG: TRAFs-binding domain-containing protein [Chitinophagaceae bacterium]
MATAQITHKPLCFIIMPFGKKNDAKGNTIDFDYVYNEFIRKVIEACDLSPIRADQEIIGGVIQKPMYERLVLCDYAIADLTTANANVFYELGIRFTARPATTFSIFEADSKPPFDLNDVRCLPYVMEGGTIKDLDKTIARMVAYIKGVKETKETDSPVYQLLDGISFTHNLSHEKVEMLRSAAEFNEALREELLHVVDTNLPSAEKATAIKAVEKKLGDKSDWDVSMCIDVMLAYRSTESFAEMADFIETLPAFLRKSMLMREQYGFALNRAGKTEDAIKVLQRVIEENGANSETCGILGRVFKDKYNEFKDKSPAKAAGFLDKAIEAYLDGYKADMRDFFPGVNAVTLLSVKKDPAAADLAKVVEFSVNAQLEKKAKKRRKSFAGNFDDYWPYATLLELAVIQNNEEKAKKYLPSCLAISSELWQRKSTGKNLLMFAGDKDWVKEIVAELNQ